MNEGLLLGIQETDEADWMGYSLDGDENITIQGNTTLIMPEDGTHTIQLFWNNSNGYYSTEVREFSVYMYTSLLFVEFVDHLYTAEEFLIKFSVKNFWGVSINSAIINAWWDGNHISDQIEKLEDDGIYQISLTPITVPPGDPPILLRMLVSADGYQEKNIELYIAVDPEVINKEPNGNLILILIITIASISIASLAIFLLIGIIRTRSRRFERKRIGITTEN